MDKKDLLSKELKTVMEEDTEGLELSQNIIDNILNSRELTWRDKINNFLNHEIEIPLAPAVIGFAALLAITIIPKDIFKVEKIKVIQIGSNQILVREKEVSRK
jgi:hypothetical protein